MLVEEVLRLAGREGILAGNRCLLVIENIEIGDGEVYGFGVEEEEALF